MEVKETEWSGNVSSRQNQECDSQLQQNDLLNYHVTSWGWRQQGGASEDEIVLTVLCPCISLLHVVTQSKSWKKPSNSDKTLPNGLWVPGTEFECLESTSKLEVSQCGRFDIINWGHGKLGVQFFTMIILFRPVSSSFLVGQTGMDERGGKCNSLYQSFLQTASRVPTEATLFSDTARLTRPPLSHASPSFVSAVAAQATGRVWFWRPRLQRCHAHTPPCPSLDIWVKTVLFFL